MFLDPEVAAVGLNELQAQEKLIPYKVAVYGYSLVNRAIAMRSTEGFIKLLVTNDDKMTILGMRAMGAHASTSIEACSLMIHQHRSVHELAELLHPHPAVTEALQDCTRMLLGKPVIAAVAGHAVAGGLELALWCDLRVVERSAVFGVFCRRWGVPLIDGGTVRLPRVVGLGRALDMILTGRPVEADEALAFGLADRVVPDGSSREAAEALALEIARFPQICMRSDRHGAYEQAGASLDVALGNEYERGLQVIQSGETREGAARFRDGAGRHGSFE